MNATINNLAETKLKFVTGSQRYQVAKICPCGKNNKDGKFTPYLGFDDKGYCHSCGEIFLPETDKEKKQMYEYKESVANKPIKYLPFDLMEKSVLQHDKCSLYSFLKSKFRQDIASKLCVDYLIGTSSIGDTVFWQVDIDGNVRQAKIMKYDPLTGRRNKETGATFVGRKILNYQEDINLQQCFFGEFLLSMDLKKPIALIESEKSAVIASIYYPQFIWIATGGKNGAGWTERKVCKVLAGRNVILFPDLGAYDSWKEKGALMAAVAGCKLIISDILEINASEEDKKLGLDLADFLLTLQDSSGLALSDGPYPIIFDYDLKYTINDFKKYEHGFPGE